MMKVLVTGSRGFVGRNLCETLRAIGDGRDRREQWKPLLPLEVLTYDIENTPDDLARLCAESDFIVHLAGVNRPADSNFSDNVDVLALMLERLERAGNDCPVLLSSSTQATLIGRYEGSAYGKSKLEAENLLQNYADSHGSRAYIYRFPNLYGKWCRPNYNSAVATFCDAIANDKPYTINDPTVELELAYIDDVVEEILSAIIGEPHIGEDGFCQVLETNCVTLGEIVDLLKGFKEAREDLFIPDVSAGSFSKKLYSTYLSYLNPSDFAYKLNSNEDNRGSFTEFLRTADRGQVSVNVSKPGITKGQHWHHTKWEKFLVLSGEALIHLRRIGEDADGKPFPVTEYRVSGDEPTVVEMIPGYTHNIVNISQDRDLVTVMWANEMFDPLRPDTYYEEV